MPSIPTSTKCASLGCREQRSRFNSFCIEHGGKDRYPIKVTEARAAHNAMYQTGYWYSIRKHQLSTHPICASCIEKGRVTPAHHVDHVFPWVSIGDSAFFNNIFQSLCASCHSEKTWYEQRGIIKHYGHNDLRLEDYARVCPSPK